MTDKAKATTPPKNQAVELYQRKEAMVTERAPTFSALLPANVKIERFKAAAMTAIRQNPDLVKTNDRSFIGALSLAAQDGLLPDAREGVILPYKDTATWIPMLYGLRKRARELASLHVSAEVIYSGDTDGQGVVHGYEDGKRVFKWHRAPLGMNRGEPVGAFAIFEDHAKEIVHIELMDKNEIETVKAQSKAQGSLMWKTFWTEAWKKTVVRRGFKSVPAIHEKLDELVRRNDDDFDFDERPPKNNVVDLPDRPRNVSSMLDELAAEDATVIEHDAPTDTLDEATSHMRTTAFLEAIDTPLSLEEFETIVAGFEEVSERLLDKHKAVVTAAIEKRREQLVKAAKKG